MIAEKYVGGNVVGQAAGMMGMGGHSSGGSHGGAGASGYGGNVGGGGYGAPPNVGGTYIYLTCTWGKCLIK